MVEMKFVWTLIVSAALALGQGARPTRAGAQARAAAQRVEQLMKDGEAAREAELVDEAIRIYGDVVKLSPRRAEAWWYLGMSLYDRDRYPEAERAFARLVVLDRTNGAALAMLGLTEYQNGRYDLALKHLLAAKTAPAPVQTGTQMDTVARFHLIALLNRAGQHDLASVILQEFAKEKDDTPLLVQAAGINLLRLRELPGKLPAAEIDAVEMAGRAVLLAWRGKVEESKAAGRALVGKYPRKPNAHYTLGYVLMLAGGEGMAGEMEKEIGVSPDHVQARLQIANDWMKKGESERGIPYAQKAVELAPEDFMARQILGRLLLDVGRTDEAIGQLQQAVRLAPECLQCHSVLANAYARTGRTADAEKQLKLRAEIAKQSEAVEQRQRTAQ